MMSGRLAICIAMLYVSTAFSADELETRGIQQLPGLLPALTNVRAGVTYEFDLQTEKFDILIPSGYTGSRPFGLVVFISPSDTATVPEGWDRILKKKNMIFIAPQEVGNRQLTRRRAGLAIMAAEKMKDLMNIDSDRVFVAGFSGGARVACMTALYHPDVFSGCIAICGAEFYEKVDKDAATREDDYGYFELEGGLSDASKASMRFALITGSKDFRYGNIIDLYKGGFQKHGVTVKLLDVRGMGHEMPSQKTLSEALEFVDQPSGSKTSVRKTKAVTLSAGAMVMRTWTSRSGLTLDAKLTKVVGSQISLEKADGATSVVRLSQVSRKDREFVKKAVAR